MIQCSVLLYFPKSRDREHAVRLCMLKFLWVRVLQSDPLLWSSVDVAKRTG